MTTAKTIYKSVFEEKMINSFIFLVFSTFGFGVGISIERGNYLISGFIILSIIILAIERIRRVRREE